MFGFRTERISTKRRVRQHANASELPRSKELIAAATADISTALLQLDAIPEGLSTAEVSRRQLQFGPNQIGLNHRTRFRTLLRHALLNPLVLLLFVLASISFATRDPVAGGIMLTMLALGVGLQIFQEAKADAASEKLKAMIRVTASAVRDGSLNDVALSDLVPGDIVELAAGDMVPADVRFISTKDLFVTEGILTGESYPVEKFAMAEHVEPRSAAGFATIGYLGTSIASGSARAVVVTTGKRTFLGGIARLTVDESEVSAFDKGIETFTWLMIRFVFVMAPLVFLVNGLVHGNWGQAFLFSVAVAVGMTPEMLPMIVTVCLSNGALAMSEKKVIVKRLNAIQNLGAMDVLCTDKTGTLTADRVVLEKYCDVALKPNDDVLVLAYLNSHFQTGLKNVLDRAVLQHTETHAHARIPEYSKVDEIPFDFQRRIMSVVVRTPDGRDCLISKGAPEALFPRCSGFTLDGQLHPMDHEQIDQLKDEYNILSQDGFRVLAIASRTIHTDTHSSSGNSIYSQRDECDLILNGYIAFFDPPKDSAAAAIHALQGHGIEVKVLTGDNDLVARKICKDVGLRTQCVMTGDDIEQLSDQELGERVEATSLFARVTPIQKQRIIKALQGRKHAVGYMGDGINDAPALHAADVGISVDTAADVAKEAADLILLEKSLLVLENGVVDGRKVFANILKYVRMGASSNFGNVFSVLAASIFVPFLPMAPIQILANNLLYDFSQTVIPTDDVDPEQIEKPRPWDIGQLARFILLFGPCSSIFDCTTFFFMLYVFGCWHVETPAIAASSMHVFQTGWFVESVLSQALIIHIIRTNRLPFVHSRASRPVLAMTIAVAVAGILLPRTQLGHHLGLVPLPSLYWPILAITLCSYLLLTQTVKLWLLRSRLI